jgi:hypothetical protein
LESGSVEALIFELQLREEEKREVDRMIENIEERGHY